MKPSRSLPADPADPGLRRDYRSAPLLEAEVHADPVEQFRDWFQQAVALDLPLPNAMALATATRDGKPAVRYVLLKDLSAAGFSFYTHASSAKGKQIADNPEVALAFYWSQMHRQVRVEGQARLLSAAESDAYFNTRPDDSRLAVWVAEQSSVVESRAFLEARMAELERQYGGEPAPRPANWVGYRVKPERMEFWQGRESRLHDRLLYAWQDGGWRLSRLAP